jgi:hypothetical protein
MVQQRAGFGAMCCYVLQDGTTVTTACYTMRRMAHLVPDAVLPLVCQRFEVRLLSPSTRCSLS